MDKFIYRIIVIALLVMIGFILSPRNYNCSDFKTYDEAYRVFKQYKHDIYELDRDGDGIPCESLMNNLQ